MMNILNGNILELIMEFLEIILDFPNVAPLMIIDLGLGNLF